MLVSRVYRFFHHKLLSVFFLLELLSVQWKREMINNNRTNLTNLSWDRCIIVIYVPIKLFHYILHKQNQHFLERLKLVSREISSVEEMNVFWKFSFLNIRTQRKNVVKRSRLKERRCTFMAIVKKTLSVPPARKLQLWLFQQRILKKSLRSELKSLRQ